MSSSDFFYTWQNHEADAQLAKRLQEQFNHEQNIEKPLGSIVYDQKKKSKSSKSLVDPSWELVDPTPDIYNLFNVFNQQFFWGKLGAVSVKWSKRMTSCAGVCSYNYRGGLCVIALSEPLLKLRPRKDLVETLLHEMIHALLFVTNNNKDRDGHGPEFHNHMYRINAEAGTNITVYHTFHDEVRLYKQHWWKCNGPCQHKKPFYGLVKRAQNRAPGPNDFWWGEHSRSCGGTFIKIREPEKKPKSNKENKKPVEAPTKSNNDIRNYIPSISTPEPSKNVTGNTPIITITDVVPPQSANKSNGVLNKVSSTATSSTYNGKNNINGFHNIDNLQNPSAKNSNNKHNDTTGFHNIDQPVAKTPIEVFSGSGNVLTKSPVKLNSYDAVRESWLKKLNTSLKEKNKRPLLNKTISPAKKILVEDEILKENKILVKCPVCNVSIEDKILNTHLDTCLDATEPEEEKRRCLICEAYIPISDIDRHTNACLDDRDFELYTCPVKDNEVPDESITKKKCDICGINQNVKTYDQHLASCLIIFCGEIQDIASSGNSSALWKKNEESIYLDSDEEESFINDNSLMEDYNKSNNVKKEIKKSEGFFDYEDEEGFVNDTSMLNDDYNISMDDSRRT